MIKKVKKLEHKLRQKRKRKETEDEEDAEGQDQDIPSQGNKFATPEKSKDSGEAQAEQITPHGSKIYRRKPKSTTTPTKVLDFEEPAERPVNTASTAVNTGNTPSAPMTEEDLQAEVQASKKSREQELQELAGLEAAQRLQATMDAE
ncbi:hypothetical protein Tco_1250013, partial [Tanacetum coccineum]